MEYSVITTKSQQFIDITGLIRKAVNESGVQEGIVVVYVPHTTAGVTVNENSDPDVITDILSSLNKTYPVKDGYLHFEGNSHAHIKASLMGSSCNLIIENGEIKTGIWQGIYFCEFDGPRNRKLFVKVIKG